MHEGTPIKSHIAKFSSIINDLDKIEVKLEDEDQERLLLCFLSFSYKSFKEAIIYGGKSTIKVNKVKEHLLNKDKLILSWRVSLIMMIPGKFIIQGRIVIMKVLRVTQNTRIWCVTIITKRGTLDLSVDFERRNNEMLISLN